MLTLPGMLLCGAYVPLLLLTSYFVFVDVAVAAALVLFAELFIPEIRLSATSVGAGELCLFAAVATIAVREQRLLARRQRQQMQRHQHMQEQNRRQDSHLTFAPDSYASDNILQVRIRILVLIFAVLGAATLLTILHAQFKIPVLRETAKTIEYFFAAILGFAVCARRSSPVRIFIFLGILGIAVAVSALIELKTGTTSVFRGDGRLIPRIAGVLEGPNQLAAFLALLLPSYVIGCSVYQNQRFVRALLYIAATLATVAIFLTFSRAGIATGIFGMCLAALIAARYTRSNIWMRPALGTGPDTGFDNRTEIKNRAQIENSARSAVIAITIWIILGAAAAGVVAGPAIMHLGTIGNEGDTGAVGHRGDLWRAAIFFWQSSPIIGIGAGNYENELAQAGLPHVHTHANSLYLQSLAEGGVILFTATLASIVIPLRGMARRLSSSPIIVAAFAALLAYALHQFVDTLSFFPKIGILAWVLTGAALGVSKNPPAQPDIDHYAHQPAAVR